MTLWVCFFLAYLYSSSSEAQLSNNHNIFYIPQKLYNGRRERNRNSPVKSQWLFFYLFLFLALQLIQSDSKPYFLSYAIDSQRPWFTFKDGWKTNICQIIA